MKPTSILGIIFTIILAINVKHSLPYRVVQPDGPELRKVTWAKVLDSSNEKETQQKLPGTHLQSPNTANRPIFPPNESLAKRSNRIQTYRSNHETLRQQNYETETEPAATNNGLQKRALDLLYHKFVEPRIHKNIESRPSLIEELIQTFESHVQKDLAAWSKATSHSYNGNALQGNSAPVAQPKPDIAYSEIKKPIEQITSVAEVEQGDNEDTFVVTDETGITHIVSVDDIINSLAQMDENEISKLLIGTPIEPTEKIERRSSSVNNGVHYKPYDNKRVEDSSFKKNAIQIPVNRQLSEKVDHNPYVDENEVILIKSEDGDTRLVTRKDVMLATVAAEKKSSRPNQHSSNEILTTSTANKKNAPINTSNINSKSSPFLTLEDVADIRVANDQPIYAFASEQSKRSPSIESFAGGNSHSHQLYANPPAGSSGLESIRESLAEMRKQQQKEKEVLLPAAIPPTFQKTAPNSPPVQILNSPAPGTDSYLLQSPITIQHLQTRQNSDSGIRDKFSNFFSRLIGKKINNIDISHRPKVENDQYVQVVMPNQNSDGMEQVTIPLPRPIHYETRHTRSTTSVERKTRNTQQDSFKNRSGRDRAEYIDADTAEIILKTANVPPSIQKTILAQINNKPKFEIPGFTPSEKIGQSKHQGQTGDKTERKDIFSHVGYTYQLPPITYDYGAGPFYGGDKGNHVPHYEPHHSPPTYGGHAGGHTKQVVIEHDLYQEDQPLVDINLLADLKYLSKVGYQDESFSFPRIGDGSKFVDTRQKYYY